MERKGSQQENRGSDGNEHEVCGIEHAQERFIRFHTDIAGSGRRIPRRVQARQLLVCGLCKQAGRYQRIRAGSAGTVRRGFQLVKSKRSKRVRRCLGKRGAAPLEGRLDGNVALLTVAQNHSGKNSLPHKHDNRHKVGQAVCGFHKVEDKISQAFKQEQHGRHTRTRAGGQPHRPRIGRSVRLESLRPSRCPGPMPPAADGVGARDNLQMGWPTLLRRTTGSPVAGRRTSSRYGQ